jgi:4-methyl-5(b-hydroxyethyl)-thiazole monophosphate biosynthesis
MPRVIVPLAEGVEEMEAVILLDVLRRAKWEVHAVGLQPGPVRASRGVGLLPDSTWSDIDPTAYDVLAIPGGAEGARRLQADGRVLETVRCFVSAERWVGAVCAGPLVLQAAGVLDGRKATCHPAVADKLIRAHRLPDRVVVDGRIVTSQGPGTCFEFALTLIRLIDGSEKAQAVAGPILLPPTP